MNILVFGSDSRTHAFAWKLINSAGVEEVIVAPGNAGTSFFASSVMLAPDNIAELTTFVLAEGIDLVIADERSQAAGVVDELRTLPLAVFGANKALHQLQTSRCAAREWLQHHGLPLPRGRVCTTAAQAEKYATTLSQPLVVAGDAPSSPVVICTQRSAVLRAVAECMEHPTGVVVEELVQGPLVTASILTDGTTALPVPPTRIYCTKAEPYAQLNGAHSAATPLWAKLDAHLQARIRQPLLAALQADQIRSPGWLSTICVIAQQGPLVQSLHVTPPELEVAATLPRLASDVVPLLLGCAQGTLAATSPPEWRNEAVVVVALHQPEEPGIANAVPSTAFESFESGVLVFQHASTPIPGNSYVPRAARYTTTKSSWLSFGGTTIPGTFSAVIGHDPTIALVLATGNDLLAVHDRVYTNLRHSTIAPAAYRPDIGVREL